MARVKNKARKNTGGSGYSISTPPKSNVPPHIARLKSHGGAAFPVHQAVAHKQPAQKQLPRSAKGFKSLAKKARSPETKTRRARPGTVALREIRKYQKTTDLLIPKAPFSRLVREIVHRVDASSGMISALTRDCLLILQEAAEACMVQMLEDAQMCAIHAKRVTIMTRDVQLGMRLRSTSL